MNRIIGFIKELILFILTILGIFNLFMIFGDVGISQLFWYNISTVFPLILYTFVTFYIGIYLFFLSISKYVILKYGRKSFLSIVFISLRCIFITPIPFFIYALFDNIHFIGALLLLVSFYVYFVSIPVFEKKAIK